MKNKLQPIAKQVYEARGWDNLLRQLMLAGKQLGCLPEECRVNENEVSGCQSRVWLTLGRHDSKTIEMLAWSDSKIIRGVLAVIQEKLTTLTGPELDGFDFHEYFKQIHLDRYLSESRANGITHVIARIRQSEPVPLAVNLN